MPTQEQIIAPLPQAETALPEPFATYQVNKPLFVTGDLPALGPALFKGKEEGGSILPVLAEFDTTTGDKVVLVKTVRDNQPDRYSLAHVKKDEDGAYDILSFTNAEDSGDGLAQGRLQHVIEDSKTGRKQLFAFEKGDKGSDYDWKFSAASIIPGKRGEKYARHNGTIVSFHKHTQVKQNGKSGSEIQYRNERSQTRNRRFRKAIVGIVASKLILAHGGLIDEVGDAFNQAQDTVRTAIPAPTRTVLHPDDRWSEGMTYRKAPVGQMAKDQEIDDRDFQNQVNARETIARVMDQLDNHEYTSIEKGADDFAHKHQHEMLAPEQLQEYNRIINEAKNSDEVISALQKFTSFYGIESSLVTDQDLYTAILPYDPHTKIQSLKATAHGIVNAFGWLPKSLINATPLRKINIGGSQRVVSMGALGEYGDGEMNIHVDDTGLAKLPLKLEEKLETTDSNDVGTDMHEWGHAKAESDPAITEQIAMKGLDDSTGKDNLEQLFWATVLHYPQAISAYSKTNEDERIAEDISGVLSDRSDGLASPDDWRRFNSPANRELLRVLYVFEQEYPGITAYIVKHNKHLMPPNAVSIETYHAG